MKNNINIYYNQMSNANNGLLTKIWGPPLWESLHAVTFGYPMEPTDETKEKYKAWLISLGDVLPCSYCRNSYKQFIKDGDSALTDNDLLNRENLCKWGYRMHNRVNNKLGVDYGVKYEEIVYKYESYRAKCVHKDSGCTMPIDLKADSYKKSEIKHAPIVPYSFANKFTEYAEHRGLVNFRDTLEQADMNLLNDDRRQRDNDCTKLIYYMRKNSIDCTEVKGEYEGLPTLHELALLSMRCSNISEYVFDVIEKRLEEWKSTL